MTTKVINMNNDSDISNNNDFSIEISLQNVNEESS